MSREPTNSQWWRDLVGTAPEAPRLEVLSCGHRILPRDVCRFFSSGNWQRGAICEACRAKARREAYER